MLELKINILLKHMNINRKIICILCNEELKQVVKNKQIDISLNSFCNI